MKKLIIATGLLMATSAYAQTEVLTGVTRGKDYGVVYSLPKTQIELEIKAVSYTHLDVYKRQSQRYSPVSALYTTVPQGTSIILSAPSFPKLRFLLPDSP